MEEKLALAIEIADLAEKAAATGEPVDVQEEARRLVREHPEASASEQQVADALAQEAAAARFR
jgi:hypothetical protein